MAHYAMQMAFCFPYILRSLCPVWLLETLACFSAMFSVRYLQSDNIRLSNVAFACAADCSNPLTSISPRPADSPWATADPRVGAGEQMVAERHSPARLTGW
jgi:hypothetical protein